MFSVARHCVGTVHHPLLPQRASSHLDLQCRARSHGDLRSPGGWLYSSFSSESLDLGRGGAKQGLGRPWWEGGGASVSRMRPIASVSEGKTSFGEVKGLNVNSLKSRDLEVLIAASMTIIFGVANKVLYKLALVPLKNYPFFLAQFATLGYVVVYFSILYMRYKAGIVTDEMIALPKYRLLAVGALEALGVASGMAAGTVLSGASIPILSQTFLVWQLILSFIFLGRRYSVNQIFGCLLISIGVIITVSSEAGAGTSLQQVGIIWPLLMIVSFLFQAGDTILKEIIFLDAAKQLKGGSVDLFIINSFGSGFQALFILLLLPFLSRLWGVPFSQLPNYLRDGTACFINAGSLVKGCEGAPLLPLLFILVNMGFNISLLHLLKISSAVVSSLAATVSVPLSIYMFTLPLPYIGVESSLTRAFLWGAIVLVIGLFIYNLPHTNAK